MTPSNDHTAEMNGGAMVVVDDVDAAVVDSMKKASDKTICIFTSTFDDCTCTTLTYKF